jgi:hypothetical protein
VEGQTLGGEGRDVTDADGRGPAAEVALSLCLAQRVVFVLDATSPGKALAPLGAFGIN